MKTVVIGLARFSSTRLRGKILMNLGGHSVMEWVVRACRNAAGIDEVWIATSTDPADDITQEVCATMKVPCFRGSENDVLTRFYETAIAAKADIVVRITCDCPYIDPSVLGAVVRLQKDTGAAYCSNVSPRSFSDGLDCEAFTFAALKAAYEEATCYIDRECVTTWIHANQSRFPAETVINWISNQAKERYVLDTSADYEFCKALAARWPWHKGPPSQLDILGILDKEPELRKLNSNHVTNERYQDALAEKPVHRRNYSRSTYLLERAESRIPLSTQTFSKSKLQFPQPSPLFLTHGQGGIVWDVNGNSYIDMVSGLLPNILGYCDPDIDGAIRRQLARGISFSLATELEAELAEMLVRLIPCAEMVRFGKTGTDATTAAVRLARAYTGCETIIICGGYHGWASWSCERDTGITDAEQCDTLRIPFGTMPEGFYGDETAAVIVEPETNPHYLKHLREWCDRFNTVLIFDEVITGFRFNLGGAQKLYGVTPDLACFGKAMANGMPLSAVVGKREIMKKMAPPDNIFYSGTFFGETLSLAASIATIRKMKRENIIPKMLETQRNLHSEVINLIYKHASDEMLETRCIGITGNMYLPRLVFNSCRKAAASQIAALFRKEMIATGTLIIASHNICAAHSQSDIKRVLKSYDHTLGVISEAIKKGEVDKRLEGASVSPEVRTVSGHKPIMIGDIE